MPLYTARCPRCKWTGEVAASIKHECLPQCPSCNQSMLEHDWSRRRAPAIGNKPWTGRAARSMSLVVKDVATSKQQCPSFEFDATGHAVFRGDKHHRQCLRELDDLYERSGMAARHAQDEAARKAEVAAHERAIDELSNQVAQEVMNAS
jgi:hypothetical protein